MAYLNEDILGKYISNDELIKLTDDENFGSINPERLNEAINAASNEFENYLRDVYDIAQFPTSLPEMLIQLLADLTIYNLYKRRYRLDMPESITEIYKMAIDKLLKISRGEMQLTLPKLANQGFIKINKTEVDRIFNQDELDKL